MSRSVSKPEFQYSPSKNIYWDKLHGSLPKELEGLVYSDQQTEAHRGQWRTVFKKTSSADTLLHVEIGCNAGHVSLEWAKQKPQDCFIGIDWKFKQVYRFAEKISHHQLQNLFSFRANAERLQYMFAPGEIDFLYLYFPDPWPKKAQKKNRTADAEWLKTIAPLLSPKGYFHIKTDHEEYFDFILSELKTLTNVFETFDQTRNLHEHHPDPKSLKIPEVTLFERLFIKDGLPIYSIKLKPKR